MSSLNNVNLTVASNHRSKRDLSCDHITSASFMQLAPVYYRHMMPGESISCNAQAFARLAPMAVPTYGRSRLNMRCFFVPFRTVFPNFNAWLADTIGSNFSSSSLVQGSPILPSSVIVDMFVSGVNPAVPLTTIVTSPNPSDFKIGSVEYAFTRVGARLYKILRSLGYALIVDDKLDVNYSALGLLAYCKVFFDWYSLSQYADSSDYLFLEKLFKYNDPTAQLSITKNMLYQMLSYCSIVAYDGDYFTSQWDNPSSPNSGLYSSMSFPDVTNDARSGGQSTSQIVTNDSLAASGPLANYKPLNGTPFVGSMVNANSAATAGVLTQYVDTALHMLTDYMRRNQISGAKPVERLLARYGKRLSSDSMDRSIFLGTNSIDVNIGDVTQTSNTASSGSPSNLGDYGGRGYAQGSKSFDFTAEEFGLFVVCSSILPSGGYYQGFDRNNLHTDKLDFWTPEFDNLSVQATVKGEVYVSNTDTFGTAPDYLGVFGYAPRYAEWKVPRSFVTGDIDLRSVMQGGDSWHLMRKFDDYSFLLFNASSGISGVVHSRNFCRGFDASSYNRIFNDTEDDVDKFYIVYHFDVSSSAPCKSLFDNYDFEEAGKVITMQANGVKVN